MNFDQLAKIVFKKFEPGDEVIVSGFMHEGMMEGVFMEDVSDAEGYCNIKITVDTIGDVSWVGRTRTFVKSLLSLKNV